jgi:hypothetical protein
MSGEYRDSLSAMRGKQVRILTRFGWIAVAELSLPTPSSGGAKLAHPIVCSFPLAYTHNFTRSTVSPESH